MDKGHFNLTSKRIHYKVSGILPKGNLTSLLKRLEVYGITNEKLPDNSYDPINDENLLPDKVWYSFLDNEVLFSFSFLNADYQFKFNRQFSLLKIVDNFPVKGRGVKPIFL